MLKAAIEKFEAMAHAAPFLADGRTFVRSADGDVVEVRRGLDVPEVLDLNSLDALVKMIRSGDFDFGISGIARLFVSVKDHRHVLAFSDVLGDLRNERMTLYRATATDIPGWDEEVRMPFDKAAVALMTRFQESEDREYALRLLSQITTGAKVTYADNGIATTIVTQKGVAMADTTKIRPLVKLRPYRTFQEVEQPEGIFLIRIDERGITFTEADGGMWKLAARKTVKAYLENELKDVDGVTVML